MKIKIAIIVICSLGFFLSCKRIVDPAIDAPETGGAAGYRIIIPQGWPEPVYKFTNNEVTEDKFILGRALFYEPMLSRDNTISCGFCHQQVSAFANNDHNISHGIDGRLGNRNSPSIFNITWHPLIMHDGGINHLEVQPLAPISNPQEMDEDINRVLAKLSATQKYRHLFNKAYGSEEITTQKMFRAMAQFMGLMYSYNSKYDKYKRGEDGVTFTEEEARGYSIFLEKCNACHAEPLFSDFKFRNNGLAVHPTFKDSGRARITHQPEDLYKFKTPSLRNVAFTQPYMHDGRYTTLMACLEHYSGKVLNTVNLDPLLQNNGIQLTLQQRQDLIAFLHTLSDFEFIKDPRFKEPRQP